VTNLPPIEPLPAPHKPPRPFSEVAVAAPKDFPELVYFLLSVRDEIDDGEVEDDLLVSLADTLTRQDYGICFIVRGPLGIEGSVGILFERPRLARPYHLRALWNVVAPAARNTTGHAKSLLLAATGFADSLGRKLLLDACQPPHRVKLDKDLEQSPKIRLCSRYFDTAGRIFAYLPRETEIA
jgi:hypothetical protein